YDGQRSHGFRRRIIGDADALPPRTPLAGLWIEAAGDRRLAALAPIAGQAIRPKFIAVAFDQQRPAPRTERALLARRVDVAHINIVQTERTGDSMRGQQGFRG